MEGYIVMFFVIVLGTLYMQPCIASVCLTWTVENENIVFRCKTDELIFPIVFYSPTKEIAFCNIPVPSPECISIMPNNIIKQDMRTQTTILIYKGKIDSSINGEWKCRHGPSVESGTVNITVLVKDAVVNGIGNDPLTKNHETGICSSPILGSISGFCGTLHIIWIGRVFIGVPTMLYESYKRRLSGITANKLKRYNTVVFLALSFCIGALPTVPVLISKHYTISPNVVGFTIFYVFGSVVAVLISVLTDMYTYVGINVQNRIQDPTPQVLTELVTHYN